ncbi:MAG: cytochrome c biogenesis protein CcsA [Bacteroidales bacterium]|nr:cytochrome c biogenesis protein CcsA [Bacteroidales bacterium]
MKKLISFLSSPWFMTTIIVIFFISIATATFIEYNLGTATARALIYDAAWFYLLLLFVCMSLIVSIIKHKLYQRKKFTVFVFHIGFVVIIVGAGITRFTGSEGSMMIREGEAADWFFCDKDRLTLSVMDEGRSVTVSKAITHRTYGKKKHFIKMNFEQQKIMIWILQYLSDAVQRPVSFPGGAPMAELVVSDGETRDKIILQRSEIQRVGKLVFAFEEEDIHKADIHLFQKEDRLYFTSDFEVEQISMTDHTGQRLPADSIHAFETRQLYYFGGHAVVLTNYYPKGRIIAAMDQHQNNSNGRDALLIRIEKDTARREVLVWKDTDGFTGHSAVAIGDEKFRISFGPGKIKLPFRLYLKDFHIERYPGSKSPSWYESKVIVQDSINGMNECKKIYMNNVLRYKGYRFYQSSYDNDEKGTVLSVNHDIAGTLVTYAGYLLMTLGMVISLINRNSRFRRLARETVAISRLKKMLSLLTLFTLISLTSPAQKQHEKQLKPVDGTHATEFGKLLIQDVGGRIEPVNTMSSQVLRKFYRKDKYRGMSADQVILGMIIEPDVWQHEPIIRTRRPLIKEISGNIDNYLSFSSFFNGSGYLLQPYVENAYRKKPAYRSKFDNEIIRLDERINIMYLVFTGDLLRIFPKRGDSTLSWYAPSYINSHFDSTGSVLVQDLFPNYVTACRKSLLSGNWKEADRYLTAMANYQREYGSSIIPPQRRINAELYLNRYNVFERIAFAYGLVGSVLLIYQLVCLFYSRIRSRIPIVIAISFILILFTLHTAGLVFRWYVSGHAPWSNGYEVLVFIAWASVMAGIIFAFRSGIALSVTSVLACLILHTAHLSWMDPQITNLVPVLKSYWLVLHVATITVSYGFLALGTFMAFINLWLMVFQNRQRFQYIQLSIEELSRIIEMTLIIGLYLLAIGTFLGGVWANQSWGRYWGWDPKETWALATILVYAFIVHIRLVPGLKGLWCFNLAALLGFSSVIMTYFGVNYYLSGLHSYAAGDPLPVPAFVYYTLGIIALLAVSAYLNQRRLGRQMTNGVSRPMTSHFQIDDDK